MADPSATDIIGTVRSLFEEPEMREIHERIRKTLRPLHSMDLDEDLPEHFTRGDFMALRVPTLAHLSDGILADCTNFPSTTQVTVVAPPYDDGSQTDADNIEKWGAMFRARCDEGRRTTRSNRWHLLLDPYSIMLLRCEDPSKPWRWTVEIPEPTTCAFPLRSAPFRPSLFGRKYKMLVKEVAATYGKGNREFRPGEHLIFDKGVPKWVGLTDDWDEQDSPSHTPAEGTKEVQMWELDDGKYITTVCCGIGKSDRSGEIVNRVKNLTGGVRAVVLSAGATPRRDKHRYQPMLWPVYQLVLLLNHLRAMRATRSVNVKPDVLVEQTPEQIKAAADAGAASRTSVEMESGGPNLVMVNGRPTPWELLPDPDLDKSIQDIASELASVVASYSQTANEKVIQEANVNVFLPYAENVRNKQAPMLAMDDWGWSMMEKMALASIHEYAEPVPMHSMGTEFYGDYIKMDQGTTVTIDPSAVDLDRFNLTVLTQSITEAERRALIQDYAYRKSIGVSTHKELLTAAGYNDTHQQVYDLTVDAGLQLGYTWNEQQLATALAEELRLTAGILIPNYSMPPGAPPAAEPPGGGLTVNPPPIQGGTGGSGVPGTNGFHP